MGYYPRSQHFSYPFMGFHGIIVAFFDGFSSCLGPPYQPSRRFFALAETSLKPVMDPWGTTLVQLVWWQVPCAARYLGAEKNIEPSNHDRKILKLWLLMADISWYIQLGILNPQSSVIYIYIYVTCIYIYVYIYTYVCVDGLGGLVKNKRTG